MKKYLKLLAVMLFGLFGFSSCQSEVDDIQTSSKKIKVDIMVADAPNTRAAKTAWTVGDKIHIFFSGNQTALPDCTITFNGSRWNASEISEESVELLEASEGDGYLTGFWESSNQAYSDLDDIFEPGTSNYKKTFWDEEQEDIMYCTSSLWTGFQNICYSFDGETLTATLDDFWAGNDFQVIVTGLEGTNYLLSGSDTFVYTDISYDAEDGILYPSYEFCSVLGAKVEDGVSFALGLNNAQYKGDDFALYLADLDNDRYYTCEKVHPRDYVYSSNAPMLYYKVDFKDFTENIPD